MDAPDNSRPTIARMLESMIWLGLSLALLPFVRNAGLIALYPAVGLFGAGIGAVFGRRGAGALLAFLLLCLLVFLWFCVELDPKRHENLD